MSAPFVGGQDNVTSAMLRKLPHGLLLELTANIIAYSKNSFESTYIDALKAAAAEILRATLRFESVSYRRRSKSWRNRKRIRKRVANRSHARTYYSSSNLFCILVLLFNNVVLFFLWWCIFALALPTPGQWQLSSYRLLYNWLDTPRGYVTAYPHSVFFLSFGVETYLIAIPYNVTNCPIPWGLCLLLLEKRSGSSSKVWTLQHIGRTSTLRGLA